MSRTNLCILCITISKRPGNRGSVLLFFEHHCLYAMQGKCLGIDPTPPPTFPCPKTCQTLPREGRRRYFFWTPVFFCWSQTSPKTLEDLRKCRSLFFGLEKMGSLKRFHFFSQKNAPQIIYIYINIFPQKKVVMCFA